MAIPFSRPHKRRGYFTDLGTAAAGIKELAAATALDLRFLSSVSGIHTIASAFQGRFQLLVRGQMLVVTHCGLASRERHYDLMDSVNCFQGVRYTFGTAFASHTCYFQSLGLHGDASFYRVE